MFKIHIPKETNDEIKTKRNAFSFASENDIGESMFFNADLKLL